MATRCDDKYIKNDETFSFDKFLTTSNILKLCIMVNKTKTKNLWNTYQLKFIFCNIQRFLKWLAWSVGEPVNAIKTKSTFSNFFGKYSNFQTIFYSPSKSLFRKEIQRVPFRKEDVYLTIGLLDLTFTCFFLFFSVYRCSWINRDIAYRIIDFCYSALASYAMNLSSTLIVALEDCDGMKAASVSKLCI